MSKKFFQTAKTLHKKVLSVHSQSSMMKWGLLKTHSNPMCMYISRHGMTWHFRIILNRLVSRGLRLVFGLTYKVIVYLSRLPKPSLKIRTASAICWNYLGLFSDYSLAQRKMLVLVNGNKFKKDRQQHNSTSNFVSANSLIAKFTRYDASSIASLCVNASD